MPVLSSAACGCQGDRDGESFLQFFLAERRLCRVFVCDLSIRSSIKDSRTTVKALLRNKAAIAAPTRISGQLAPKIFTPIAATNTDRLAMI
jgi:hypothetical protein